MFIEQPLQPCVIHTAGFDKHCFWIYIVRESAGKIIESHDGMSTVQ